MLLDLVTPPSGHVLDLATVRRWLTLGANTSGADETIENDVIPGVEAWFQAATNRLLLHQHWTITLRGEELVDQVRIPLVPLVSVQSITSYSTDGTKTEDSTLSTYSIETGESPTIAPADGCAWPSPLRARNSLVIACTCGYGTAEDLAASRFGDRILFALKCLAKYLWDNPGGGTMASVAGLHDSPGVPEYIKSMLASLRVHGI